MHSSILCISPYFFRFTCIWPLPQACAGVCQQGGHLGCWGATNGHMGPNRGFCPMVFHPIFTAPCTALAGPWAAVWAHGSTLGPAWAAKASWAAWAGCGVGPVAIVHLGGTRVGCQTLNVTKTATKPACSHAHGYGACMMLYSCLVSLLHVPQILEQTLHALGVPCWKI